MSKEDIYRRSFELIDKISNDPKEIAMVQKIAKKYEKIGYGGPTLDEYLLSLKKFGLLTNQ